MLACLFVSYVLCDLQKDFNHILPTFPFPVSADFGFAVFRRYSGLRTASSFVAHLMGITIGLTIGLFILKNYEQRLHERLGLWVAFVVYIIFILFVVFWNIFYKPGPTVAPV